MVAAFVAFSFFSIIFYLFSFFILSFHIVSTTGLLIFRWLYVIRILSYISLHNFRYYAQIFQNNLQKKAHATYVIYLLHELFYFLLKIWIRLTSCGSRTIFISNVWFPFMTFVLVCDNVGKLIPWRYFTSCLVSLISYWNFPHSFNILPFCLFSVLFFR